MEVFPADIDDGGYDRAFAAEESDKDDDDGGDLCRICRSPEGPEDPLRYGCACRGSKYFHQECLRLLLDRHGNKQCEVCKRSYSLVPAYVFPADNDVGGSAEDTDKYDVDGGDLCRICRSPEGPDDPLRCGCACRGSKYFHQECLRLWLDRHGNKQCQVCKRSYSFPPVNSENAPERLPRRDSLRRMSLRVPIRRVLCLLDDNASAVLATSIYVSFFFVLLPFMMGRLFMVVAATQLLSGVSLAGYWTMLSLVIPIAVCSLVRFYGSQKDYEDRFRTLRIGLMLVLAALSMFLISTISMAFLILVGWTFFHHDLYGFWIGCYLLRVIHIMIRRTDLLLNRALLWIRMPFSISVCRRSYSFPPVNSENAPERLPRREFLRGLSLRALRVAAYLFVFLFNAFCFSLHPWGRSNANHNQRLFRVSEKFAFLLSGVLYNGWIAFLMAVMAVLKLLAEDFFGPFLEINVEEDEPGLRGVIVVARVFWKHMLILCDWWHDRLTGSGFIYVFVVEPGESVLRPRNAQFRAFGAFRKFLLCLDDNAFAVIATSTYVSFFSVLLPFAMGSLVIAVLLLFQPTGIATQLLSVLAQQPVTVGYVTMLQVSLAYLGSLDSVHAIAKKLSTGFLMVAVALPYGLWIFSVSVWKKLYVVKDCFHIMIRRTDLHLNRALLWIRIPFTISDIRSSFPRTRGKTDRIAVGKKRKWRSTYFENLNIRESLREEIERTGPCAAISLRRIRGSKPCLVWGVSGVEASEVLLSKDYQGKGGPVRNQGDHENCWSYACGDLCSSQRLISGVDSEFRTLSSRYLTFYVSPEERNHQRYHGERNQDHLCHGYPQLRGLEFIRDNGGIPQEEPEEAMGYDCMENPPLEEPEQKYTFEGDVDLKESNKIEDLYEWLLKQPVEADMVLFEPEYEDITTLNEVYEGPKSDMSQIAGMHSVLVLKIKKINGKWAALVKLSHGLARGENGYMYISLSTMIVNAQFSSEEEDEEGFPTIRKPSYLLRNFTCPVIRS